LFVVGIEDPESQLSQERFDEWVGDKTSGIPQVRTGVFRKNEDLVAKALLESETLGPDEISNISTAATQMLEATRAFREGYE